MNKHARAIRDEYGVPYQTALRWIEELGLDAAIDRASREREQIEAWRPAGDAWKPAEDKGAR